MIRLILSYLLHYANRETKNIHFYAIKDKILQKHGKHIGYDIQFIDGKKCYSCDGTGIYKNYYHGMWHRDTCWNCWRGWFKRPTWNILQRIQFGKFVFHKPYLRVYEKPDIETPIIEGYIDHNSTKWYQGPIALFILGVIYEKGYLKRFYKENGLGWRSMWWHPCNYILNAIHIHKKGWDSYPFRKLKERFNVSRDIIDEIEDLPF